MQTFAGIVAAILLVAGAWLFYTEKYMPQFEAMQAEQPTGQSVAADMGWYPYTCANGSDMIVVPASDMNSIEITLHDAPMTLTKIEGEGARYETNGATFVGAGEEVTLKVNGYTTTCRPVPSADMAPLNWGDPAEGAGSMMHDPSVAASEQVIGMWKSREDAQFGREFKSNGVVVDTYTGKDAREGLWKVFSKNTAPKYVTFPMDDAALYLQLTMAGTPAETLNFKIVQVTPESLELVYLDRGGMLTFTRVQ